jgi:hypothetical protein
MAKGQEMMAMPAASRTRRHTGRFYWCSLRQSRLDFPPAPLAITGHSLIARARHAIARR